MLDEDPTGLPPEDAVPGPGGPRPLPDPREADALLRSALIDESAAVAVSLRVAGLPLSESVTVVFHGRRDLATVQTYVAPGARGAGETISAREMLRVPCDLDLAGAEDREAAEALYLEQAQALRDAITAADTVLAVWREPLADVAGTRVAVHHSPRLTVTLPAHRLIPTALLAADAHIIVAPVCTARTLADGRPPMGIACVQQEFTRVYPLADDPERCVAEFLELAADHAHALAARMAHQEASVERFLELSDG